jgi:hypothetical protein
MSSLTTTNSSPPYHCKSMSLAQDLFDMFFQKCSHLKKLNLDTEDRENVINFLLSNNKQFLRRCLISRDLDIDSAFNLLGNFITFRSSVGWGYQISISSDKSMLKALESGVHWILSGKSRENNRIIVFRPSLINVKDNMTVSLYQKMGALLIDEITSHDRKRSVNNKDKMKQTNEQATPKKEDLLNTTTCDDEDVEILEDMLVTLLVDVRNVNFSDIWKFSTADISNGIKMWISRFPIKLRKILIINAGSVFCGVFNTLIAPLLPLKISDRVYFIKNSTELHSFIPPSIIPVELIGAGGTLEHWNWNNVLEKIITEAASEAIKHNFEGMSNDWWKRWV